MVFSWVFMRDLKVLLSKIPKNLVWAGRDPQRSSQSIPDQDYSTLEQHQAALPAFPQPHSPPLGINYLHRAGKGEENSQAAKTVHVELNLGRAPCSRVAFVPLPGPAEPPLSPPAFEFLCLSLH